MYCNVCKTPNSQTALIIALDRGIDHNSQDYWSSVRQRNAISALAHKRGRGCGAMRTLHVAAACDTLPLIAGDQCTRGFVMQLSIFLVQD